MRENKNVMPPFYHTDFEKFDAHVIQPEEYEDLPELTDERLESGVWMVNGQVVSRELGEAAFRKEAKRGRPKAKAKKTAIKIRYDEDVLEAFRATGKGWQTRMNDVLKDHIRHNPPC
jgi:uncharacterized protein (DUF4415 family)